MVYYPSYFSLSLNLNSKQRTEKFFIKNVFLLQIFFFNLYHFSFSIMTQIYFLIINYSRGNTDSFSLIFKIQENKLSKLKINKKTGANKGKWSWGRISWDRNSFFHEIEFMRSNFFSLFMRSKFLIINILQKRSGDRIGPRGP